MKRKLDEELTRLSALAAILITAVIATHGYAADDAAKRDAAASLDKQLLDDLDDSLFKGLDLPAKPANDSQSGDGSAVDEALRKQLPSGEDLGQPSKSDPLSEIASRMKAVERLIGDRVTSSTTQSMQQDIVDDLAKLIEQLQKQCSGGSSANSSASSKPGTSSSQAGKSGARETKQSVTNSVPRLGKADGDETDLAAMQKMLDEVWGHLPARIREQMQSASIEQFLPKYETLIEEYYKRLAEDVR